MVKVYDLGPLSYTNVPMILQVLWPMPSCGGISECPAVC